MWFIGLLCVVHYSLSYCEAYNFIQIVSVLIVLYFCSKSSIIDSEEHDVNISDKLYGFIYKL